MVSPDGYATLLSAARQALQSGQVSYSFDERSLRTFLASIFGESYGLTGRQHVEAVGPDTVPIEVDQTFVIGGHEAMVPLAVQTGDASDERLVVMFSLPLPDPREILQLPPCGGEWIADRDEHILMRMVVPRTERDLRVALVCWPSLVRQQEGALADGV
jgi:hypothetical protein